MDWLEAFEPPLRGIDRLVDWYYLGPLGTNHKLVPKLLDVTIEDGKLQYFPNADYVKASPWVKRKKLVVDYNGIWGRWRGETQMLVDGVSKGHERKLQLVGVGYRVAIEDDTVCLNVGYADTKKVPIWRDIKCEVEEKNTVLKVTGINLSRVGKFCGAVKKWRKPDPYKGKGIRIYGQEIKLKSSKGR